jgi:hypothetical protein
MADDSHEIPAGARVFRAIPPNPDPGSAFGLTVAMPLLWAYRRVSRRRHHRVAHERSGLPLARRMLLAVTDDRVLVWSASKAWRLQAFLGEVARSQIRQATAPTVGQGWRSVRLELVDADPVVVKVAADVADDLAALLSAHA